MAYGGVALGSAKLMMLGNTANTIYSVREAVNACEDISSTSDRESCKQSLVDAGLASAGLITGGASYYFGTVGATIPTLFQYGNAAVSTIEAGVNVSRTVDVCSDIGEDNYLDCALSAGVTTLHALGSVGDVVSVTKDVKGIISLSAENSARIREIEAVGGSVEYLMPWQRGGQVVGILQEVLIRG